jgi:hypothetical protein
MKWGIVITLFPFCSNESDIGNRNEKHLVSPLCGFMYAFSTTILPYFHRYAVFKKVVR